MNNFQFHTDAKGKDLSKLINNYNLTILNDGTPTMADFATAPDLTLATTEMSPHTTWNPINQSWWNQTCTNAIRTREKARKKYLGHKTQENKDK